MPKKKKIRRHKRLTKEQGEYIITKDNQRIIKLLSQIIAQPNFSGIRMANLSKEISMHHRSILIMFEKRDIHLRISSKLDKTLISQFIELIKYDPIPYIGNFGERRSKMKLTIPRATFVRG